MSSNDAPTTLVDTQSAAQMDPGQSPELAVDPAADPVPSGPAGGDSGPQDASTDGAVDAAPVATDSDADAPGDLPAAADATAPDAPADTSDDAAADTPSSAVSAADAMAPGDTASDVADMPSQDAGTLVMSDDTDPSYSVSDAPAAPADDVDPTYAVSDAPAAPADDADPTYAVSDAPAAPADDVDPTYAVSDAPAAPADDVDPTYAVSDAPAAPADDVDPTYAVSDAPAAPADDVDPTFAASDAPADPAASSAAVVDAPSDVSPAPAEPTAVDAGDPADTSAETSPDAASDPDNGDASPTVVTPLPTVVIDDDGSATMLGTDVSEDLAGAPEIDVIVGLSGDDSIEGSKGEDVIHGDFDPQNVLKGTEGASSFAQYGESDAWSVQEEADGHTSMTQAVETYAGETYSINFDLAANYGSGTVSGAVEVLWNGEVIGSFDTNSAAFSSTEMNFEGIGGVGVLTFRSIDTDEPSGPVINTDGPIYYYETQKEIGGTLVDVKAFAEAQPNLYQVMDGQLQVFDPVTATYTPAGVDATVTTNAIGFNVEDDLLYGIAVREGTDSLGSAVERADLVMLDASGASFLIGSTPYRSWTADFDDEGNLWAFQSSLDRVTKIDVDQVGDDGVVASETFKFDKDLVTDSLWDVAYDSETDSFYGVTRPSQEGANAVLYATDISAVAEGGAPSIETTQVVGTVIDGTLHDGVPAVTFGAAINDAEGNLYVAGNSGDHDMDNSTRSSGGIYQVTDGPTEGTVVLELVSDSPSSRSNDGAADPRAADPFAEVDTYATVLIKNPEVTVVAQVDDTYDDQINGGQGDDQIATGLGDDTGAGQSGNDYLEGAVGDDRLFGGNADPTTPQADEYYDEAGNRFAADGTLLAADNDVLRGGAGADFLHGGAGHDTLDGGTDNDAMIGGSGFDDLSGGAGDDHLAGGSERDVLRGGAGDDVLIGSYGEDELFGDEGADVLKGGSENDRLDGGLGNDLLQGGVGDDALIGGAGNDTLEGSTGNDVLSDASGENDLSGGSGNDTLTGGTDVDALNGGSGSDVLSGGGGRDVLKGGTGDDVLNGGDDKDKLYGGSGNDEINGDGGSDYINASSGHDVIYAGAGRDKILMGAGADAASGGADSDWFVFNSQDRDGHGNTIYDFVHSGGEADRLDFRGLSLVTEHQDVDSWILQHVQAQGSAVTITFDAFELTLVDHQGLGAAFYDQVRDGIELL